MAISSGDGITLTQARVAPETVEERVELMDACIVPTVLTPEMKRMFAKADAKLRKRIETASLRGDGRGVRRLMDLRQKSKAAYFAAASKVKDDQRRRGVKGGPSISELAVEARSDQTISTVKVFGLTKPDSDKARFVCSYDQKDRVRQLIVKENIAAAHQFHESQYAIRNRTRQHALDHIKRVIKNGEFPCGGELDSTNHFVMVNPDAVIDRYRISRSIRDDVITNKRKETHNRIAITNSLARANRGLALSHATRGLPQGAASSSVIASASITDAIERFCKDWEDRAVLINYADNFYLFTKTRVDWEGASQDLIARFSTEEGLTLRVRSPCRHLSTGLDILGFTIRLESGKPMVRVRESKRIALFQQLRRKMHELLHAESCQDRMLDQIYFEAVSMFVNKLGPLLPATRTVHFAIHFFGRQLIDIGARNDVRDHDKARLARFCRRRLPSDEKVLNNTAE